MNFLAHIYLSGDDPNIQLGNFIGDFVKGRNLADQFGHDVGRVAVQPGENAAPGSPPFRNASRVSSESPPFVFPFAWHLMHVPSRSGLISFAKSTWCVAGGGSFA